MNDLRKPYNSASLFIESFLVLGRCWKQLLGSFVLAGLVAFAAWVMDLILPLPPVIIKFFLMIPIFYVFTVFLRIIGKSAAGQPEDFYDSCAASRLPAFYQTAFSIIFVVIMATIAIAIRMLEGLFHMKWLSLTVLFISVLIISIRLIYASFAIALDEEGPLEAIAHSWQLSSGLHFFTALGIFVAYHFLPALIVGTIVAGFKFVLPGFNFLIGIFVGALYLIGVLAITAFAFLVFLNQDTPQSAESSLPTEEQIRFEQDLAQAMNQAAPFETPTAPMPNEPENPHAAKNTVQQPGQMPTISFDDQTP